MIQTHPEIIGWGVLKKLCNKIDCNESMNTYLSPLKTSPRANITFSDSNNISLNLAEELGNLPANLTQSETISELSDPELSGDLFNSVNPFDR